jgi:hypothetical protein
MNEKCIDGRIYERAVAIAAPAAVAAVSVKFKLGRAMK